MKWIRLVRCPNCGCTKEVSVTQRKWKCENCKKKFEVAGTMYRQFKKAGAECGEIHL